MPLNIPKTLLLIILETYVLAISKSLPLMVLNPLLRTVHKTLILFVHIRPCQLHIRECALVET